MKIIVFLLACIMLAISCMPCKDRAYAVDNGKGKAEISTSHNPADDNCNDDCSPFCACSCCSGFVFNFPTIEIEHLILPTAEKFAAYLPADVSDIPSPVWQPPQLV